MHRIAQAASAVNGDMAAEVGDPLAAKRPRGRPRRQRLTAEHWQPSVRSFTDVASSIVSLATTSAYLLSAAIGEANDWVRGDPFLRGSDKLIFANIAARLNRDRGYDWRESETIAHGLGYLGHDGRGCARTVKASIQRLIRRGYVVTRISSAQAERASRKVGWQERTHRTLPVVVECADHLVASGWTSKKTAGRDGERKMHRMGNKKSGDGEQKRRGDGEQSFPRICSVESETARARARPEGRAPDADEKRRAVALVATAKARITSEGQAMQRRLRRGRDGR